MFRFLIPILALVFIACFDGDNPAKPQDDVEDYSLLVVKVDYDSLITEGIYEYRNLPDYDGDDDLPLNVIYKSPGDFGSIAFTHKVTNDTIFSGGIIWMGQGEISHPSNFDENFTRSGSKILYDDDYEEYYPDGNNYFDELDFDEALFEISNIDIVKEYMASDCEVGVYFYPPSVGVLDPTVAKYIIFLYVD